jgi:hypothetical protein
MRVLFPFVLVGFSAVGCGGNGFEDEAAGEQQLALTATQERVLGFESPLTDWSSSRPRTASNVASQGTKALGISPNGWTEITSIPLSSLVPVGTKLSYDIRVPQQLNAWGETRMVLQLPSQSIHWQELGSFSLVGKAPGVYHRVEFALPPSLVQKLNGTYNDLVLKVIVNAPTLPSPYLIDNLSLSFDPSTLPSDEPGRPVRPPLPDDQIELAYTIGVPADTTFGKAGMVALESVTLGDDVSLLEGAGGHAKLVNLGTGPITVGKRAQLGSVLSRGNVELGLDTHVYGDVKTQGTLTPSAGVSVDGSTTQGVTVESLRTTSYVRFPKVILPAVTATSYHGSLLAPGRYQSLTVNDAAKLTLSAGDYHFDALDLKANSILKINDSAGPVRVFVGSTLAARGTVQRVAAGQPDFRLHFGGTNVAQVGGLFRGSLLAPNATIELKSIPGGELRGFFLARFLKIDSLTRIARWIGLALDPCLFQAEGTSCDDKDPCTLGDQCSNLRCRGTSPVLCLASECKLSGGCDSATGLCSSPNAPEGFPCSSVEGGVCSGGACTIDPSSRLPSSSAFAGKVTDESELNDVESEEMQGIAESSSHWYWISVRKIFRVPVEGASITEPVDDSTGIPESLHPVTRGEGFGYYNHFGDGDFAGGFLFVPVTGAVLPLTNGPKPTPIVAVFDADLNFRAWAKLPKGGAWLSVNPIDGHLYTSDPFFTLRAFDMTDLLAAANEGTPREATLGNIGYNDIQFAVGLPRSCKGQYEIPFGFFDDDICKFFWNGFWVQGGDFSPNGVFHYVLDHEQADDNNLTGVHIFDSTPFSSDVQPSAEGIEGPPATQALVSPDGYLRINYDATTSVPIVGDVSRGDELEGVTVYRGVDEQMHVLVQKLSNEVDDDDVTLYHFTTDEP